MCPYYRSQCFALFQKRHLKSQMAHYVSETTLDKIICTSLLLKKKDSLYFSQAWTMQSMLPGAFFWCPECTGFGLGIFSFISFTSTLLSNVLAHWYSVTASLPLYRLTWWAASRPSFLIIKMFMTPSGIYFRTEVDHQCQHLS